jgi:hypothetical protein
MFVINILAHNKPPTDNSSINSPSPSQNTTLNNRTFNLSKATIDKARQGAFVNLSAFLSLATSIENEDDSSLSQDVNEGQQQIILNMNKKKEARPINDFVTFVEAFLAYISVVVSDESNPDSPQTLQLLHQYLYNFTSFVRDHGFAKAAEYDIRFRKNVNSFGPEWGKYNMELFVLIFCKPPGSNYGTKYPSTQYSSRYPPHSTSSSKNDICRNYNSKGCSRRECPYRHLCLTCRQSHPAFLCKQEGEKKKDDRRDKWSPPRAIRRH